MNNPLIEFACNVDDCIRTADILNLLPEWKTRITEVSIVNSDVPLLCITFIIAATTKESVDEWLQRFQDKTKTTYSIRTTNKCTGTKVMLKRQLWCHHNTKGTYLYHQRTKNTNCPSKINITLRTVKKRKQGRDPADAEMPCHIFLVATHNHGTESADALRFRKVGSDTKTKLLNLFNRGHSPATALESLKMDILLNNNNHEYSLSDRRFCPDYGYCHRLYVKVFKKEDGFSELNNNKDCLLKRISDFNEALGENSVDIFFCEATSDYCVCVCPPMFRRAHEYMKSTTEIVFVDSSSISEHGKSKIIILFAQLECGDLPLGILIVTSENTDLIIMGLQHLQTMIGDTMFGGNSDGPPVFLINNSFSLRLALNVVWPKSECFMNTFQILQSVWQWIIKQKNEIPEDKQFELLLQFKAVLQAGTERECEENFEKARMEAQKYSHYVKFIENYWDNRGIWAICYQNPITETCNSFLKQSMQLFREKIFEKLKPFNVIQALDFVLTNYLLYYEKNLLDAACNQLRQNLWNRIVSLPSQDVIEQIQIVSDNLVLVPTDSNKNVFYIVNIDVLSCTCCQKSICKHVEWASFMVISKQNEVIIEDVETLKMFYIIATGNEPSPEWLLETYTAEAANPEEITSEVDISITNLVETPTNGVEGEEEEEKEDEDEEEEEEEEEEASGCTELTLIGQTIIEEIATQFNSFLEHTPETVIPILHAMNEKIKTINTTNEFITLCKAFTKVRVTDFNKDPNECGAVKRKRKYQL